MQINEVVAVITGGASGLGAATAQAFVAGGAQVTIFDRDPAGAAFAAQIGAGFAQVDVTDEASVVAGLDQAGQINVAGKDSGPFDGKSIGLQPDSILNTPGEMAEGNLSPHSLFEFRGYLTFVAIRVYQLGNNQNTSYHNHCQNSEDDTSFFPPR